MVFPFDLFRPLLVGGGSLLPCSLPRPAVVRQHMQMDPRESGQGEQFQSVYDNFNLVGGIL